MADASDDFELRVAAWLRASSDLPAFDRPSHAVVESLKVGDHGKAVIARRNTWAAWASLAAVLILVGAVGLSLALPQFGSSPLGGTVNGEEYRASIPYELQLPGEPQLYGTLSSSDPDLDGRTVYRIGAIDPLAVLIADADGPAYRLLWGPRMDDAYPELCRYLPPEQQAVSTQCVDGGQSVAP